MNKLKINGTNNCYIILTVLDLHVIIYVLDENNFIWYFIKKSKQYLEQLNLIKKIYEQKLKQIFSKLYNKNFTDPIR